MNTVRVVVPVLTHLLVSTVMWLC